MKSPKIERENNGDPLSKARLTNNGTNDKN